ncbi:MAG TPA: cytochrome c [Terriglobia bacterium]|jgi:mono/diheme cytochrome c family protein
MKSWKLAAIAMCFFLGCNSREGQPASDAESVPSAPQGANVALTGAAKGEQVYFATCSVCHDPISEDVRSAPSLKGYFGQPPHKLADGTEHSHTEAFTREFILRGNTYMPPMDKALSAQDLEDVLAYLRTL